jgi:hypothetical protein
MKDMTHKLGILAFGSLIHDPGDELKRYIINQISNVVTPFKVEYGRKSSGRGNAPTLIPVSQGGKKVKATLLILSNELGIVEAKDMLYRRELNKIGSDITYIERENPTPNQLVIGTLKNIRNVETVLTANFGSNLSEITPEVLADLAISSYESSDTELGRDGISYLYNNIANGIVTPLTEEYKNLILKKMNVTSLDELLTKKRQNKVRA